MLRDYLQLTKPGMVAGNLLPAVAGFLLASKHHFNGALFIETLVGLALIIAAACAFNNYLDRDIDAKMRRTRSRALVRKTLRPRSALIFADGLLAAGTAVLAVFSNGLALTAALAGFFSYVFIYGYAKRHSHWGTLVGSFPGAMPPLVGYCSVTGRLDAAALILFLTLVFWQMPHFYAIAIYRRQDYADAGLPIWSVKHGLASTKRQMLLFVLAFTLTVPLLYLIGPAGRLYLLVSLALALGWLALCLKGFSAVGDINSWARRMFGYSLLTLLGLSTVISLNPWLS
jgi:heme o synthase